MTAVGLRTEYRRELSQYRIAAAESVENVQEPFRQIRNVDDSSRAV